MPRPKVGTAGRPFAKPWGSGIPLKPASRNPFMVFLYDTEGKKRVALSEELVGITTIGYTRALAADGVGSRRHQGQELGLLWGTSHN